MCCKHIRVLIEFDSKGPLPGSLPKYSVQVIGVNKL